MQSKMQANDNLYSYFQYIWSINKYFGLANRSMNQSSKKTSKTLTFVTRSIYGVVIMTTTVLFVYYRIKKTRIQRNGNLLPQYADTLTLSSILCGAAVAITVNLLHQNDLQTTLKQIDSMDKKIGKYGEYVSHKNNKLRVMLLLGCTGAYWTVHFIYYNFYADGISDMGEFLFWVCTYVPFIVSNVYTIQFTAFCLAIETLYQGMNSSIAKMLNIPSKRFARNKEAQIERLRELQILYNKLYKILTVINDIHSLPILILMAAYFIFMFACSYFCIFGYMYKNQFVKPQSTSDYLVPIIPSIPIFLQFILTILASEYVTKQRMVTGKIIYHLPSQDDEGLTRWVRIFKYYCYNHQWL